jgi:hypothetical protein
MIAIEGRLDQRKKPKDGLAAMRATDLSLLTQCHQVVAWIARNNSVDNPFHRAEADHKSEAETAAAWEEQLAVFCHIQRMVGEIIGRRAVTGEGVQGKIRVLDTLTTILSWERDSLRDLRVSIEQDQLDINRRLSEAKPDQRPGWFHRISSFIW